jgi:hypothetical protein
MNEQTEIFEAHTCKVKCEAVTLFTTRVTVVAGYTVTGPKTVLTPSEVIHFLLLTIKKIQGENP